MKCYIKGMQSRIIKKCRNAVCLYLTEISNGEYGLE